jgi:hypothetical protein
MKRVITIATICLLSLPLMANIEYPCRVGEIGVNDLLETQSKLQSTLHRLELKAEEAEDSFELDMAIAGVEVELMKLEVLLRTAQEQALKPLSEQATDRLTTLEKLIKQFGQDRDLVFDLMFLNPNMIGYTGLNYQQLLAKVESLEAEVISCENLQVEQGPNSQY